MAVGNVTETKHSAIPEFEHLHQGNNCKENREPNIPYDHDADFECPPPAQKRNKTCLEPSTCNANLHPQQLSQAQTATGPCIPAVENMTVGETFVVNTVEEVLVHIKDFGMKHNFKVSQLHGTKFKAKGQIVCNPVVLLGLVILKKTGTFCRA